MEYYYDISLNFFEYPVQYYEWEKEDDIERVLKIPIIRVEDIKDIIMYYAKINIEYPKLILSDTINCIAIEIIDGNVAYLSMLRYEDEECINDLVENMEVTTLDIELKEKRKIPFELRKDTLTKKLLSAFIKEASDEILQYIYYDITEKSSSNIKKIKEYLLQDIHLNFNDKYINLYEKMCK